MITGYIASLCCWGTPNKQINIVFPNTETVSGECAYSSVDFTNGVTITSFTTSKTSLVFRVEWSTGILFHSNSLDILYKQNRDDECWGVWEEVAHVDPSQGWAEFEIPFYWFAFYDGLGLPPTGFFGIQRTTLEGYTKTSFVMEGTEEKPQTVATAEVEMQEDKADGLLAEQDGVVSPTSHLWLYVCVLLGALCAVFYFVRRKKA
jgi:hypothetical protein